MAEFINQRLLLVCALACAASPTFALPCEAQKEIATGTLCVVRPSKTDPQIQDTDPSGKGFGDHVVGIPSQGTNGLSVHLAGSGGKPYLPQQHRYLDEVWISELMGQGYTVLDLAYSNTESITEDCKTEANKAVNNCAGAARLEVITGSDASPIRQVNPANSVKHRTAALVNYLHDNGFTLPADAYPFKRWPQVDISGHSQGSGTAYYIAKNYGVQFACLLGGPYDVPDNVPAPPPPAKKIADWYLDDAKHETPVEHIGAFLTTLDDYYGSFTAAYDIIGLEKGQEWFEADKARYTDINGDVVNGHAASVQDPSLASLRAKACFR